MDIKFRPLGVAREIIENIGLQISWAFDDMIFIEGNPFILRFNDENSSSLYIHFNIDCFAKDRLILESKLKQQAQKQKYAVQVSDNYRMSQKEGVDEIDIEFIPSKD